MSLHVDDLTEQVEECRMFWRAGSGGNRVVKDGHHNDEPVQLQRYDASKRCWLVTRLVRI